jgi:hypothetical protein
LQQFGFAVRRLDGQGGPRLGAQLMARAADLDPARLGAAYLASCALRRGDRARFIDKLPGNFLHLPLILAALPNARIVHLVRGPMDACFASFKQLFAEGYPHSYDQGEQARHFVRYHRLMAHWRAEFPGRFLDVSYEALVQDFAAAGVTLVMSTHNLGQARRLGTRVAYLEAGTLVVDRAVEDFFSGEDLPDPARQFLKGELPWHT